MVLLGSRSIGGIVLAMTLTATYQCQSVYRRVWSCYKYGLGWVLLAMIQLPAVWLSLGILGKKSAILARRYNAVTLNEYAVCPLPESSGVAGEFPVCWSRSLVR
ncbi:sodium:solute symporter family transporter [Shigella sonnei]